MRPNAAGGAAGRQELAGRTGQLISADKFGRTRLSDGSRRMRRAWWRAHMRYLRTRQQLLR